MTGVQYTDNIALLNEHVDRILYLLLVSKWYERKLCSKTAVLSIICRTDFTSCIENEYYENYIYAISMHNPMNSSLLHFLL